MLLSYLKIAFRNLRKFKIYSLINLTGLAVGMACFILISLWIYDETHYDTFHENSGRLFRLILQKPDDLGDPGVPSAPYILPEILKEEFPEIRNTVRVRDRAYSSAVRYGDIMFYEDRFFLADPSFFAMFSYRFIKGDPESALARRESLVITEEMAGKYFGREDPMGKTVRWNNAQDLVITGVIEDVPYNSHLQFDFVAPLQLYDPERLSSWWREAAAYVLLEEGTAWEDVDRKIAGIMEKHHPEDDYRVRLQPIRDAHLNFAHGGRGDRRIVSLLAIIAVGILFIASINFMNLSTARSRVRALEVGIRKVSGARRSDLVRQFLGEAVLHSFFALILAVALVDLILPYFNRSQGKEIALLGSANLPVFLFLAAVTVVTGFAAGCYPAFFLSSFEPVKVLKKEIHRGSRGAVIRTLLVIAQFSASVVMIVLAVSAQRQMTYIQNMDLGFDRDLVVHMMINEELREKYDLFKERLLGNSGVLAVTAASAAPHLNLNVNDFEWEGKDYPDPVEVNFLYVDHDYAETFGLEIVEGRDFSKEFPTDAEEAFIVNESAVRFMGMREPLGKQVTLAGRAGRIIGVVKDFNHKPLIFDISPLVMAVRPDWYFDLLIKIHGEAVPQTLAHIERVFKETTPAFPFEYAFIDAEFNTLYGALRVINGIFNSFTVLALLVSCLGLFGLASLLTEQRKKEVGIRKVLGASPSGIIVRLSRKFLLTVLAANIVAAPLAVFVSRQFLRLFAFRIPFHADVILGAFAVTLIIAALTIVYHVLKAASTNPVDCLRYE